jgi:tetratricopeptide (TPR) repeat protein
MRRVGLLTGLALVLAGCVPAAVEQRLRDYTEDGLHLYQVGDYRSAGESFRAALALRPEDVGLLYNVGECYDRIGDSVRAEHYFDECLQRAPDHAACRHALVVLLVRQGRWSEAVALVEDWLAREPERAAAYATDGWLWHQAGDLPRAQGRLQQALRLDPHDSRALIELALVYEELQRPDRAAALYERALDANPNQPDLVRRLNQLRAQGVGRPRPD